MIGSLGQPLLFLIVFGFGFGAIYQKAGGGNYIQFLAPGIILMSVLFVSIFSGIELIWDRQFGFLKETLVAPVPRLEIVIGRTLGGATVASIQGVIVFVIALMVGFHPYSYFYLPVTFGIIFITALLFTALGTAIASFLEDMQGFQIIMNFLVMPIFFLSGALFPLQNLPAVLTIITRLDPLAYGVDAVRYTLIGTSVFGLGTDLLVLTVLTAITLGACSYFFDKIQV